MSIFLSQRVQNIKPSPTLAITAQAKELKAQGRDIIGLGAGEPDFDTPEHIKQAAIAAINAGFTKYTAVDGIVSLKQAIIDKFAKENRLDYELDQILVSCGGKHSFYNLAQALLNPGDEVIIPAPYWVSYPDMVVLADAKPVILLADKQQNFKITPAQLRSALTEKTRLVVLNSPSNPTGVAYHPDELRALAEVLLDYPHAIVATDDMYEHIVWQQQPLMNIINCCPELYSRSIVLNGVSKAYSMTGWRIGYAAGPTALIKAMKKIQSQSTSNPTSIAQVAAEAALRGDQQCIRDMVTAFRLRHDFVVATLNQMPGVSCLPADGTFYCFPDMSEAIQRLGLKDDLALTAYFLDKIGVAMIPGSAFGAPGYMRISFATSMDNLQAALTRVASVLTVV